MEGVGTDVVTWDIFVGGREAPSCGEEVSTEGDCRGAPYGRTFFKHLPMDRGKVNGIFQSLQLPRDERSVGLRQLLAVELGNRPICPGVNVPHGQA